MIPHVNDSKTDKDLEEVDLGQLYQYEKQNHLNWYDQILLNRPLKVVISLLLVAVLAPLLIYHFMFFSSLEQAPSDGFSDGTCVIPRASRLPCGAGHVPRAECHPQCCYDLNNNFCFHRHPSRFSYIMDREWTEEVILQPRIATVPFAFQNSLPNIRLTIDEISPSHMSLQFYNAREMSLIGNRLDEKNYMYEISLREMGIAVEASQGLIFSTIRGPLIASNDIWELAFKLTNETMYGLGELPLRPNTVKIIYNHRGGLSAIPLIFAKINSSYHGVLIESEAPTEVHVHEDNQIVIRSLTNSGLKLHVFVGPQPSDVMTDAIKLIGVDAHLEYWMLGAHICSESLKDIAEAYEELNTFMSTAISSGLPFESHCGAAPVVFDSACDPKSGGYQESGARAVKAANKRYMPHVSPYIRYHEHNETSAEEIEMYQTTGNTCENVISKYEQYMLQASQFGAYVGSVGDNSFVYPVFENASVEFMQSLWAYEFEIDGIILENSWPLDDSPKSNETSSFLPYFSKDFELAFGNTPKVNVTRPDGTKYLYKHNKYGNEFENAFRTLFDADLPTWSSSQFMNGRVKINRQSIGTSWTNLRNELVEAALGGISGHWSWFSPICGDTETFDPDTHTSLCLKWYMAATYLPFIKIHSFTSPRHPLAFSGTNRNLMIAALNKRLNLLPYFFTTMQSGPLLRPMFYQFPSSEHLKDLNTQFSVGNDLVIVPNLQPSQSHVHFWIPPGTWYELWGGLQVLGDEGDAATLTTTEADFVTFIRGGSILIMQKDVKTTAEETRLLSAFSIIVAFDCHLTNQTHEPQNPDSSCLAEGSLFITNTISLVFRANERQFTISTESDDFGPMCEENKAVIAHIIRDITAYGLQNEHNNYDNYRLVTVDADLCELKEMNGHELVISLI